MHFGGVYAKIYARFEGRLL